MRSIIKSDDKIYVLMHMEAAFSTLKLNYSEKVFSEQYDSDTSCKGIYTRELNQTALLSIHKELLALSDGCSIFIDMMYIREIGENATDELIKMIHNISKLDGNNTIVFFNVDEDLRSVFRKVNTRFDDNKSFVIIEKNRGDSDLINEEERKTIRKKTREIIENACEETNELSPSSRVKLTKYVNLKNIMPDTDSTSLLCYLLAIKLIENMYLDMSSPADNKNKRFLVHTINGAIFGGLLCRLFSISMNKVDHLGPKNHLFLDGDTIRIQKNINYITISDVICIGREISTAKTALKLLHANYYGSAAIVNIIPTRNDDGKIISVINITPDDNFISYKIITDL